MQPVGIGTAWRDFGLPARLPRTPAKPAPVFNREITIDLCHHDVLVDRCDGAMHHQQVAAVDAGLDHRPAADPPEERGERVCDEEFVEVLALDREIVSGWGKSGAQLALDKGQRERIRLGRCPQGRRRTLFIHKAYLTSSSARNTEAP